MDAQDGSYPDSCPPRAPPLCARGPCCDELAAPVGVCGLDCPSEFSSTCMTDPAAFCAGDFFSCEQPDDCALTASSNQCCEACVRTVDNSAAVHRDRVADYHASLPPADAADCPPPGRMCGPCIPRRPEDDRVVATCRASRCEVAPIRATDLTACTDSTECRVRALSCCECGADLSEENVVAVRTDAGGALGQILCGDGDFACPECEPIYEFIAYCADDGHCALARPEP